jgi:murein hydrolase activator
VTSGKTVQAKQDLDKLRAEIVKYEVELREHEAREAKSRKNLSGFNAHSVQLRKRIDQLKAQEAALAAEKSEVDTQLTHTTKKLDELKSAYANGARYLYQSGMLRTTDANEFLLAPEREDSLIRMRYYAQVIAKAHHASGEALGRAKAELGESSADLATSIANERLQIGRQTSQQQTIEQKRAEEAKQLVQIQANKERLRKLLAERKASAKKLENMIAALIAREEKATKERAIKKREKGRAEAPEEIPLPGPTRGPHSLSWPTSSHRIVQGFGEHRNAELNTVTMNLGIDIAESKGSPVMAAADGIVSIVSSLPSYGTIVVVRHSGNLHTVYADLAVATTSKGEHVRAGQTLGRSGANEENGPVLHFEVWKGRAKQNPLAWLK